MAPDENDLRREEKVLELLKERFHDWQENGYIPNSRIEPGDKNDCRWTIWFGGFFCALWG